jgi:mannose-6-phosphate isomerase-like protein (cupin superfamily)
MTHHAHRLFVTLAGLALALPGLAADAPPPPAPGSPGLFVSAKNLAEGLEEAKKKNPGLAVATVGVSTQYSIHQVFRGTSGPPAVHKGFTELHYVLDGGATFVTGGTLKGTGPTAVIEGGVTQKIAKGDAVIVPPDTPHWYQAVDGSITYLEVRFVAPPAP